MTRTRRLAACFVAGLVLLAVLAAPGLALAEAAHPAGGAVDVQIWPQEGQTTVIIALDVPESVKLPAVVRLPVPTGNTIQWAGEILGGDAASDPSRPFKLIKTADGGQYAEFTLFKSRRAQIDTAGLPLAVSGSAISGRVDWIQSVTAPTTTFSVRIPPNAAEVKIQPAPEGAPDRNATGEALYQLAATPLAQGAKQSVSFAYTMRAVAAAAGSGSQVTGLIVALGIALVIAVAVLLFALGHQRRGASGSSAGPAGARPVPTPKRRTAPASTPRGDATPDDDDSAFLTSD